MFNGFNDREEAGRILAQELLKFQLPSSSIVLALPRGGVPVGYQVARTLNLPLDVLVVRKLGVPGYEELAFGAIASGGALFLNKGLIRTLRLTAPSVERVIEREKIELKRREQTYRGHRPPIDVRDRTVIVVDDGLATGSTMRVAIQALREQAPERLIVAVPVASAEACAEFGHEVDQLCICARTPEPFYAVGLWYRDFPPTTDEEVRELIAAANERAAEVRQLVS